MTEWPSYKVADDAVVHALGVMNINYVPFETTHVLMLASVADIKQNQAAVFISRMSPTERANVIEIFFKKREWLNEASSGISHYIKAMRILTENRNTLIHGNIVDMWAVKSPGMNREGLTTIIQSSLPAIRQVADDLHAYSGFGFMLFLLYRYRVQPRSERGRHGCAERMPAFAAATAQLRPSQPKKPVNQP